VHTTASTASGFCHTVTAICRYRGRVGTGLSVLWVAYALKQGGIRKDYFIHVVIYWKLWQVPFLH
jgi:hypothetical protein